MSLSDRAQHLPDGWAMSSLDCPRAVVGPFTIYATRGEVEISGPEDNRLTPREARDLGATLAVRLAEAAKLAYGVVE